MSLGYTLLIPVVIYYAKKYQSRWPEQQINFMRLWFHWEVIFFFAWMGSIVVNLQLTFWTKAGSFSKDEAARLDDDDVWNDKNTEDYLRWLKKETFDLCIQITLLGCAILIGYIPDNRLDFYGSREEFYPGGLIILILILQHVVHIASHINVMLKKVNETTAKIYLGLIIGKVITIIAVSIMY